MAKEGQDVYEEGLKLYLQRYAPSVPAKRDQQQMYKGHVARVRAWIKTHPEEYENLYPPGRTYIGAGPPRAAYAYPDWYLRSRQARGLPPPVAVNEEVGWWEDLKRYVPEKGRAVGEEIAPRFLELMPFARYGVGAWERNRVTRAERRIATDDYTDADRFWRKPSDQDLVLDYLVEQDRKSRRTMPAEAVSGIIGLTPYMLEMWATSGLYNIGVKGTEKVGLWALGRWASSKAGSLVIKTAGWLTGSVLRTAPLAPMVAERYAERRMALIDIDENGDLVFQFPEESPWTSFSRGWQETYIALASEMTGGALTRYGGAVLTKIPLASKFLAAVRRALPALPESEILRVLSDKVAYSSLIGELGEEGVEKVWRAVAKLDPGADDQAVFQRLGDAYREQLKALPVEAIVLSFPGAARYTAKTALSRLRREQAAVPERDYIVQPGLPTMEEMLRGRLVVRPTPGQADIWGEAELKRLGAERPDLLPEQLPGQLGLPTVEPEPPEPITLQNATPQAQRLAHLAQLAGLRGAEIEGGGKGGKIRVSDVRNAMKGQGITPEQVAVTERRQELAAVQREIRAVQAERPLELPEIPTIQTVTEQVEAEISGLSDTDTLRRVKNLGKGRSAQTRKLTKLYRQERAIRNRLQRQLEKTPEYQAEDEVAESDLLDWLGSTRIAYGPDTSLGADIARALQGKSRSVTRHFKKLAKGERPDAFTDYPDGIANAAETAGVLPTGAGDSELVRAVIRDVERKHQFPDLHPDLEAPRDDIQVAADRAKATLYKLQDSLVRDLAKQRGLTVTRERARLEKEIKQLDMTRLKTQEERREALTKRITALRSEVEQLEKVAVKAYRKHLTGLFVSIGKSREDLTPRQVNQLKRDFIGANIDLRTLQQLLNVIGGTRLQGPITEQAIALAKRLQLIDKFQKSKDAIIDELNRTLDVRKPPPGEPPRVPGTPEPARSWHRRLRDGLLGFHRSLTRLTRLLRKCDGGQDGPHMREIMTPIEDATRQETVQTAERFQAFIAKCSELGLNPEELLTIERYTPEGAQPLTPTAAMECYLARLDEGKLAWLEKECEKLHLAGIQTLSMEQVQEAAASLTPAEKALADWMVEYYAADQPALNDVLVTLINEEMPATPGYSPIVTSADRSEVGTAEDLMEELMLRRMFRFRTQVERGMTMERIGPSGKRTLRLDAVGNFFINVKRFEHFKAWAVAVKHLRSIITDPSWKDAVTRRYGKAMYEQIRRTFEVSSGTGPLKVSNLGDRAISWFRTNAAVSMIGGNILSGMRATMSMPASIGYQGDPVNIRYHGGALLELVEHPIELMNFVMEKAPHLPYRFAESQVRLTPQYMIELKKLKKLKRLLSKLALFHYRILDRITVVVCWKAHYDKMMDRGVPEHEAIRYANRAIDETQPTAYDKDLPGLWRDSNFMRTFALFQNMINQVYNIVTEDMPGRWRQAARKGGVQAYRTAAGETFWIYFWSMIVAGTGLTLIRRGRLPRFQEWARDQMAWHAMPFFGPGTIIGWSLQGFGHLTAPPLQFTRDFSRALQAKSWSSRLLNVGAGLAHFSGIPWNQPRRTVSGVVNLARGDSKDFRMLVWSPYAMKPANMSVEAFRLAMSLGIPIADMDKIRPGPDGRIGVEDVRRSVPFGWRK